MSKRYVSQCPECHYVSFFVGREPAIVQCARCSHEYPFILVQKPEQWLQDSEFSNVAILDPDGWDRNNFEFSWNQYITREEMRERISRSTCLVKKPTALIDVLQEIVAEADAEDLSRGEGKNWFHFNNIQRETLKKVRECLKHF